MTPCLLADLTFTITPGATPIQFVTVRAARGGQSEPRTVEIRWDQDSYSVSAGVVLAVGATTRALRTRTCMQVVADSGICESQQAVAQHLNVVGTLSQQLHKRLCAQRIPLWHNNSA